MANGHDQEYALSEQRDEVFTIYVNDLPVELNEDGIIQIFKNYGEIHSLFHPRGARWAYISYKTYKEAEYAIRTLNNRSPLFLKVAFQQKKAPSKSKQYVSTAADVPNSCQARDFRYAENGIFPLTDCNRVMVNPRSIAMHLSHLTNYNPEVNVNCVYPCDGDHNVYDPFEHRGHYTDTNVLWSRGCTNIDAYGKRYVTMGRGYSHCHIPEPHPRIEQYIGRVYEKRQAGFYEYGEDALKSSVGKCQYCLRITKQTCEKCRGFYCSRQCQLSDWPRHKIFCRAIPFRRALVGEAEPLGISPSSSEDLLLTPKKLVGTDLRNAGTLRRPKTVEEIVKIKPVADETIEEKVVNNCTPPIVNGAQKIETESETKQNGTVTIIDHYDNGNNQTPDKKHDEKVNDSNNETPKIGPFDRDPVNSTTNRSFTKLDDSTPFMKAGSGSGKPPILAAAKPKVEPSAALLKQSKQDYIEVERELAFQEDARKRTMGNVLNQAPVYLKSPTKTDTPSEPKVAEPISAKVTPIQDDTFISKTDFVEIVIIIIATDETLWIQKTSDAESLSTMMEELQTKAVQYEKAAELVIGQTYAVMYDEIWHRATIVSKTPLKVFYIDFGNDEPPQSTDFRQLKDFKTCPPFAKRIRLASNCRAKNINVEDTLSVKMIGIGEDGVIEVIDHDVIENTTSAVSVPTKVPEVPVTAAVEVEKIVTKSKDVKQAAKKLQCAIDNLVAGAQGYIQIYVALNSNSYAVCVLNNDFVQEYQMIYEKLSEVCNTLVKPTNFTPQVGDFVCGKRGDAWVRGYVHALGPPIRLALVDEARVSAVEQILPIPDEFVNLCSFGCICTFQVPSSNVNIDDPAEFKVTDVDTSTGERIVNAVLTSPDHLKNTNITLKNWSPTPEQKGIRFTEIESNTEVYITAYTSERVMFVQSLKPESVERVHRIIQKIAKWAQTAPKLEALPTIGQLVLAKFIDGNMYRAIVTKIENDKIAVSYVDYGNREITTLDQLRLLSDELKEEASCTVKVLLKNIKTDVPPTEKVHRYLDILVGKEQPLICTFDGIPSKDGVILTSVTGECVNDKINEYLTPTWEKKDLSKDTDCLTLEQLNFANLGEAGQTVKALGLYATESPFKFIICPYDQEHIVHVFEIMPALIQKYCESTKEHYIPRAEELCLAMYEGAWYRGVCLNPSETPTKALIHFVDFGNFDAIDHKDIKLLTKDFMSPAALGCPCVVQNLGVPMNPDEISEAIKNKVAELVVDKPIDVEIKKKTDDGYVIELPTVRAALLAEGLIKP